jgi:hypothetical protein
MPRQQNKPFLGIFYECCRLYGRVYLNRAGTAFEGRCPRCLKPVVVHLSDKGTTDRFLLVE